MPAQHSGPAYDGADASDPFGIDAEVLVGDIRDAVRSCAHSNTVAPALRPAAGGLCSQHISWHTHIQVDDFCADGFDALTRCLLSDLPLSGEEQQQEISEVSCTAVQ